MKRSHLYLLLLLAFVLFGCADDEAEPTVADFTADNASPVDVVIQCGECITFEDNSDSDVGISSFLWDFPGGDPPT